MTLSCVLSVKVKSFLLTASEVVCRMQNIRPTLLNVREDKLFKKEQSDGRREEQSAVLSFSTE